MEISKERNKTPNLNFHDFTLTSYERTQSTSMLFGFKISTTIPLRSSKISFIEFQLPVAFSLFSHNAFIDNSP